tara:strand:- start:1417 stop:9504 length:8088 start_codon:yes stop_codon:yes gene_type:complete
MDKLRKLYELYKQKGLITDSTTYEMWQSANADQQIRLFELGQQNGLFSNSTDSMFQSAWGEQPKKKDEELPSTTPEEGVDLSTQEEKEKYLSGTLSDEGIEDKEALASLVQELERRPKTIQEAQAQLIEERIEKQKEFEESVKPVIDEEKLAELDIDIPTTRAEAEEQWEEESAALMMQREALAKKKKEEFEQEYLSKVEREQEKADLNADEKFIQDIGQDFTEYFGMETDAAVRSLQNKYGKYGIRFEKESRTHGGSIKATAFNNKEYIIPLSQYSTEGRTMPQDFKAFIEENAKTPDRQLTKVEQEGVEFFSDKGFDYSTYKDMQDRYSTNLDLIKFLSDAPFKEPESVKTGELPYKDMYVDGVLRADYRDFLSKAVEDNKAIRDYLYSADMEKTRTEFDLKLQKNTEKTAKIAEEYNVQYNGMMAALNEETQKLFGIDADKLADYKPTNELDQRRKDYLLDFYAQAKEQRKLAKNAYTLAMSYFDEKYDKDVQGELVEGGKAFINSFKQVLENGRAAQTLLSIAMGLTDLSDEDTMDETVEKIMQHLDNSDTGKFSIGDRTYHNARDNWELFRALRNRPIELIGAFTGNSIAQMLPIASRLVPIAVAGGAATGSLGFTPVSILGGAAAGLNTGMAATNIAIEYTNALLDAARDKYDITKPEEFEKALQDEEVWAQARDIGLKRGLTIGAVDFLGGKFAGKMIPTSKLATPAARAATQGIERFVIDPAMEMVGETLAQAVAGQQLQFSEILAEGLGAIGSKTPMAVANQMFSNEKNTVSSIAKDLSDIDSFMDDNSLDSRVLGWTDRQERMGRIDSNKAQQIRDNISIRSESREILNVGEENKQKPSKNPEAEKRLAKLIKAKRELTSTNSTKEAFSEQISAINKEIKEIARTGDVVAVEQQADISMIETTPTEAAPTVTESVLEDTEQVAEIEKVEAEERKLTPEETEFVEQEVEDIQSLFDKDKGVQFMLETEKTDSDKKQKLVESATKLMDEVSPELESNAYEVQDTEQPTVPVEITENKELANKVGRTSVKDLVGKMVNYVMADFLKVDKNKMGGPLFGLQKGIFENGIAWASVSREAAMEIIKGAAKGDLSVVYRMDDGGIDSNLAMFDEFAKTLNSLKDKVNLQEAWNGIAESIKSMDFKKKNDFVSRLVDTSTSFEDFVKKIRETDTQKERLSLDDRKKIIRKLLPEQDIKPSEKFKKDLKDNGVTIEQVRSNLSEQMAEGAPVGSFLATFEIQDKNGNKVTEDTIEEAIMTREEAEAAGIPLHENYPIYIRGQYKSLMSDTLPAWYTNKKLREVIDRKIAGVQKTKKGRKFTSKEAETAAVYTMQVSPSTAFEVTAPVEKQYTTFIKRLSKAFPNVVVAATKEQFDALKADLNAKSLITKNQKVYGAVYEGKLYLNPDLQNYNTPIHEFGHVWLNAAKQLNPEVYKRGLELIKNSEYITAIEKSKSYQKVVKQMRKDGATETEITNYLLEEALATAIGDKGESFVSAAQQKNFKNWMNELFAFVKKLTGISDVTPEQLQDLTLDNFLQGVVVDLLSENQQFKEAEVEGLSNQLQLMTSEPDPSIDDVVRISRQNGFSDDAIKIYLDRQGFTVTDINNALSVQLDLFQNMPKEFGNVEGGMNKGMELFNQVRKKLSAFAKKDNRGALIREKALEILKDNKIFKEQSPITQLELLNAMDRSLGIRKNPRVNQEMSAIRKRLADVKAGRMSVQDAQRQIRTFIRKNLPPSKRYSKAKINKLIKEVSQTTEKNIKGTLNNVEKIIKQVRSEIKKDVIREIAKIAKDKSKVKKTQSRKRRSKGIDSIGQSYFAQMNKVFQFILNDDIGGLQKMQDEINQEDITKILQKIQDGEKLKVKERNLLDKQLALDEYSDIANLELEEVQQILKEVKGIRAESIVRLNNRREARRIEVQGLKEDAHNQIRKDYKSFYDKDGKPYDKEQRKANRNKIRTELKTNGVFAALKTFVDEFGNKKDFSANKLGNFFRNNMYHLGTLVNILDRGKEGFFTEMFWNRLSDAEENNLRGVENKNDVLDGIVRGVNKKNKNWGKWKYKLGEKSIKIKGLTNLKGAKVDDAFNKDQAMRIYALSLNEVQRDKLKKRGFTDEKLEQIKDFIGEENVQIVDEVVDYLTNTYFDEINAVFEQLNDVNLGFVENYFPTSTIANTKVKDDIIKGGDFNNVFTAENAPNLKDRTDTKGIIEYGLSFTETLEEYIKTMERYKAYANPVRQMNEVLKSDEIQAVLYETGTASLFNQNLNYAINPDARATGNRQRDINSVVYNIAAGLALALKPAQLYRQATSFIQAYDEYSFIKGKKTPVLDTLMFMVDYATVIATLPYQIKDFMDVSATFKSRIRQGLKGDLAGLEGGIRNYKPLSSKRNLFGRAVRGGQRVAGIFQVVGDMLGVLGYKAVYNRMIKNGHTKADALRIANKYNETQQSRRSMEMNPLQQDKNPLLKMLTLFGSTSILQLNNVAQSLNSVLKDVGRGKMPKARDIRKLALNYAIANVLWTASSYMFALTKGDDEDKDRAFTAIKDAAKGLTILERIPLIGLGIQQLKNRIRGEYKPSGVVNPYEIIFKNFYKDYEKVQESGEYIKIVVPLMETVMGMQFDSPIGLYHMLDAEIAEEDMMDFLGVAPSYRPGYGNRKKKSSYKKVMKEKLSKEEFDRLYGRGNGDDRVEERIKERQKRTANDNRK